ncbi:Structural maintenance of chromosomes protein 4, partial [Basidiobolus ranarum]
MPTMDSDAMNVDSHEESKPRLVIKKMALINFKSYAGRQEIGPFHKSFSAVVGPNGSGKSNVIDSLLFVFGYRANKMRQGKLSELIHSSAKYPNLEHCTVEVHFQEILDLPGPDAYKPVPNSELIVSRSAYRNNSSKYFINGNPSSYTEVTTLLKARGIDLDHKRFLILQGEVESISQMKPKAANEHEDGLLEYLEDIIGTSKYKETIKEASQELEKYNEERSEKLTRVKIVEKEKQSLESKRAEALDFVRSENNLVLKKSTLYQANIMLCDRNIDNMSQNIEKFQNELQTEKEKHSTVKDDLSILEKDYNTTVKEYEDIGQKTNEVLKELAKYDREDIELQENKKHLKSKLKKIAKEYQKDELRKGELQNWFENHSEDLEKGKSEITTLEESLTREEATLEEITAGLKGKTEKFSVKIEAKQKELAPWIEKINEKQSQIDVAQSEHQMLEARSTAGQRSLEEALMELKDTKTSIKEKKVELEELQQEKDLNDKKVSSLVRKLELTQTKELELKSVVGRAREAAQEARSSLQAASSKGTVLSSLLRLKDLGRIKGIHGRLGNLGVIDDKYDVAISTACPSLDNIVVDT